MEGTESEMTKDKCNETRSQAAIDSQLSEASRDSMGQDENNTKAESLLAAFQPHRHKKAIEGNVLVSRKSDLQGRK